MEYYRWDKYKANTGVQIKPKYIHKYIKRQMYKMLQLKEKYYQRE